MDATMGELIDGVWKSGWYDPDARGAFQSLVRLPVNPHRVVAIGPADAASQLERPHDRARLGQR